MVLKTNFLLVVFSFFAFSISIENEGPLYDQYKSKIEKNIGKIFEADGNLVLKNITSSGTIYEHYAITHDEQTNGFLFVKEVKACSLNGCTAGKNVVTNNVGAEYYDMAVIVDKDFKILNIKVLDYFSDYGYEIASKRYLKQYIGKKLCDFSNNNSDVDGISGATISYNALIGSLDEFCEARSNFEPVSAGDRF